MGKLLIWLISAGKLGKVLTTGGTMLISVFAYALVFGWPYAVGFVALLFLHEMGHFLAAKQRGLNVGAPTFIPFVGAWINLKEQPRDAETEAFIGFAGPFVGSLGALACYLVAQQANSVLLLALSYAGFFLNLFNMIPLSPFDGGRVTAALSPRIWLVGVPILALMFVYNPSPMLILVAFLAAPQVMLAWRFDPHAPENQAYYSVSSKDRFLYATYYLGLLVFLAIMTHDVHQQLTQYHV
jgi:Zn-dependent protease